MDRLPRIALAALLLLPGLEPARAQPDLMLRFVSAPGAGVWSPADCPDYKPPPKRPSPSSRPAAPIGNQVPAIETLGPLARTMIRQQPALDPRAIPGLRLQNPQDQGQPRRIAVWGDSHVAAGPFMPTLLQALRANGLSVGAHYLPPTMGRANLRLPLLRAFCAGPGWDTELPYAAPAPVISGPALANRIATGGDQSYLWLDLRDTRGQPTAAQVRIVYRAAAGSALELSANGAAASAVMLSADGEGPASSRTLTVRADAPIATLKLRVTQGRFVLHGFILDPETPPDLSFDVFGLPSATVRGWANASPPHLLQSLHGVRYDGVILEYGTNEGNVQPFDPDQYAALLTQALANLRRVFPSASCMLVGPPDRGVLEGRGRRGELLQFGRVHQQIAAIQHDIGQRFGCAAWNWQDLMGGPGGSYGWFYAEPSLMGRDLTHLSPAGYEKTGHALARSLGWE
jgi:hypothetical protein